MSQKNRTQENQARATLRKRAARKQKMNALLEKARALGVSVYTLIQNQWDRVQNARMAPPSTPEWAKKERIKYW